MSTTHAKLYVGVISGTSVDGLDVALVQIDETIRILHSRTIPLDGALRAQLLSLGQPEGQPEGQPAGQPGASEIDRLGEADRRLGRAIGHAVNDFLAATSTPTQSVAAIGSHGQTVRHRPDGAAPFTLQIGDPNQITEITGITCVADFRRRDMAAGGQGAPLVPPFHAALFHTPQEHRAVVNIGGISNVTVLPRDPADPILGFDTGPGNGLLDAWISRCKREPFDADGQWAAQGHCHAQLLEELLADPYLGRSPPKSTGREHYNLSWLADRRGALSVSEVDVQATLLEFTAMTICQAQQRWAPQTQRLLICGGGRNNGTLMARLEALAPCTVASIDQYGVDGDGLEAAAFAWLAHRNLLSLPGNEPDVSGASGYRILGAVYRP